MPAITIIANRDNFSKQTYVLLRYITYSNDDCCYDSYNYIKDLDLESVCMRYKNMNTESRPLAPNYFEITLWFSFTPKKCPLSRVC